MEENESDKLQELPQTTQGKAEDKDKIKYDIQDLIIVGDRRQITTTFHNTEVKIARLGAKSAIACHEPTWALNNVRRRDNFNNFANSRKRVKVLTTIERQTKGTTIKEQEHKETGEGNI